MSTTSQAYGLIPVNHPSGQSRADKYTILNTYATAIYKGDLVKIHTDGTLNIGDGTTDAIGVFAGVEYIDATGKPVESPYWPGATTGATNIVAYVYDDQQTVFRVGVTANASSYVQAIIGQQVDINVAAGSANTGISGSSINAAPAAAGQVAQVRLIGFLDGEYNATTNPYPQMLVQISQHQYVADKAGV